MGKRRGRSAKKARSTATAGDADRNPHSFVFHRGRVGKNVLRLVQDLRKVQEPFTATKLKAKRKNSLKDFVGIAGPLGVTHLLVLTKSELSVNLRFIRLPHGPTLTFRVNEYCLSKDVVSSLKRPAASEKQFLSSPLVVLSRFPSQPQQHHKLIQSMFQNLYPSLNVNKLELKKIKRCVLFNYNVDDDSIDFRHYAIKAVPTGVTKSTKKLLKNNKVPNLANYKDISEFFEKPGQLSESEYETDVGENELELCQDLATRGCKENSTAAVRLIELGPRLNLKLLKMESGVDEGEVLHHAYLHKTPEEVAVLENSLKMKKKEKLKRREEQEANVRRKEEEKEEHRQKCLEGMEGKPKLRLERKRTLTGGNMEGRQEKNRKISEQH